MSRVFVTLRERPDQMERAVAWFHSRWGIPEAEYRKCMDAYIRNETEYGWYLCFEDEDIIAGLGVIENDFHERKDLSPNVCAVWTDSKYRGQGIAGRLLDTAAEDLRAKGISPLYLVSDHTGFYEEHARLMYNK